MNYFVKHWQGQFSVAKAFWLPYLFGTLICFLELAVTLNGGDGLKLMSSLFLGINILIGVPAGIWWGCGVWRSCDNAKKTTNGRYIAARSIVCLLFFEIAVLISLIAAEPVSNFFPAFLHFHIENYEIDLSTRLLAQAILLIVGIGFVIYIKQLDPIYKRRVKPFALFFGCVLIGMLVWGGWDMYAAPRTLPSVKNCPAEAKNCNPYDTPENRALFKVPPASAPKP